MTSVNHVRYLISSSGLECKIAQTPKMIFCEGRSVMYKIYVRYEVKEGVQISGQKFFLTQIWKCLQKGRRLRAKSRRVVQGLQLIGLSMVVSDVDFRASFGLYKR